MALFQSVQIVNNEPLPSAGGATDVIPLVGDFTTVAGMVSGDIIEMVGLPAGYVPVAVTAAFGASAGAAFTTDCGVLSGNAGVNDAARTLANSEAWAADTGGQGAAGVVHAKKPAILLLAPTENDRGIGLKIVGTLTSLVVGTAIRLTVLARPARNGV